MRLKKLTIISLILISLIHPLYVSGQNLNLTPEEIKTLNDIFGKDIYSDEERKFLFSSNNIKDDNGNPITCNPDIFAGIIKLGIEDTILHVLFPSEHNETSRTWSNFAKTSKEYILKFEEQREKALGIEINKSSKDKFSKTGVLLFEIFLKKYITYKIDTSIETHFLGKCGITLDNVSANLKALKGEYLVNDLPNLIQRLWLKEQIKVYSSFWQSYNEGINKILKDVFDEFKKLQSLYKSFVSKISELPPK